MLHSAIKPLKFAQKGLFEGLICDFVHFPYDEERSEKGIDLNNYVGPDQVGMVRSQLTGRL